MSLLRKIIQYGLYLILFLPLCFTPFTMFPWQFGKVIFFQFIIELLLLFYILSFTSGKDGNKFKKINALDGAVFIFLFILVVTSMAGVNFTNSFFGDQSRAQGVFLWLHFGAFYFLLVNFLKDRKNWNNYLVINTIVVLVVSLTALFQDFIPLSWRSDLGGRLSGILGNPAFLSAYLILPVFILFYLFAFLKNKKIRWLFLLLGIFELYILLLTGMRGAFVGLVLGAFVGLVLLVFTSGNKKIKFVSLIFSFLFLLFLGYSFFFAQNDAKFKIPQLNNVINISNYIKSSTASTRFMAWEIALKGFVDRPVLGLGMGNYNIIFNKYYNPDFLRYGFMETIWDKPHNWLLEIASSSGVIGVFSYLSIFAVSLLFIFRRKNLKTADESRILPNVILFSGLAAYFIQSLFFFETFNSLLIFFIVLGFISVNFLGEYKIKTVRFKNLFLGVLMILSIILFFIIFYNFNYLPIKSSYYMRLSEGAGLEKRNLPDWSKNINLSLDAYSYLNADNAVLMSSTLDKMDKQDIIYDGALIKQASLRIIEVLEANTKKYKESYIYPVWAGQAYLVLGRKVNEKYFDNAVSIFSEARERAPNKQEIYFLLGRTYLYKKDFQNSEKILKQAVGISPDLGDPHWFLGLSYVASGNKKYGLVELEKGMELGSNLRSVKNILYLIDLYAEDKNYDKIIEYYKLLTLLEPQNSIWNTKLAAAYVLSDDKKSALQEIDKAIKKDPDLYLEAQQFIKDNNLQ